MCMYIAEWWILLLVAGLCMQCVNVVLKTRNFNLKTSQQVTCIKRQASCSPVPHFLWSISEIWQHIWLISYKHTSLQLTTQRALCACCLLQYIFEHWMDYTLLKTAMLLLMNSFSTKPIKKHNGTTKNYFILMNFYKMVLFSSKINIFSKLFVPKQFLLFVKYFLRPNLLNVSSSVCVFSQKPKIFWRGHLSFNESLQSATWHRLKSYPISQHLPIKWRKLDQIERDVLPDLHTIVHQIFYSLFYIN